MPTTAWSPWKTLGSSTQYVLIRIRDFKTIAPSEVETKQVRLSAARGQLLPCWTQVCPCWPLCWLFGALLTCLGPLLGTEVGSCWPHVGCLRPFWAVLGLRWGLKWAHVGLMLAVWRLFGLSWDSVGFAMSATRAHDTYFQKWPFRLGENCILG